MPKPVHCKCRQCGYEWDDLPGMWAKLTKPQFPEDTRNGCPSCRHLYWDVTPLE